MALSTVRSQKGVWTDITPLRPNENDTFGSAGSPWTETVPGILRNDPGSLDGSGRIFRSTDGGSTWKEIGSNAEWDADGARYVTGQDELTVPHWMVNRDRSDDPDRAMSLPSGDLDDGEA